MPNKYQMNAEFTVLVRVIIDLSLSAKVQYLATAIYRFSLTRLGLMMKAKSGYRSRGRFHRLPVPCSLYSVYPVHMPVSLPDTPCHASRQIPIAHPVINSCPQIARQE